jgi:16S rRNA (adenine1518-N6/adenine1519-N6)-dimethyltransferase
MVIESEKIKLLLQQYGIFPAKSKGQNFLINKSVLGKIVKAADLREKDYILEIGPGSGILTKELVQKAKKVLAVELDKRLVYFLKQKFKGQKNLEILQADILKIKNSELYKKLVGRKGDYKIVANLPYNITGAFLRKFLVFTPKPKEMVLLLQKEVAQRILAEPGKMNLLSLSVQLYSKAELVDYVGRENFYPVPEVDSAIIKFSLKKEQPIEGKGEKKFWQMVKIGFSSKRKQLQNNLAAGLNLNKDKIKDMLKLANLRPDCRPQDLSLEQWLSLYKMLMA